MGSLPPHSSHSDTSPRLGDGRLHHLPPHTAGCHRLGTGHPLLPRWMARQRHRRKIECILLSDIDERVTNEDAAIICSYHEGWLVDMDEGHGPDKNRLLKRLISDAGGQGRPGWPGMQYLDQWWIGATVNGPHGDHQWGNWTWDHTGTSIEWYDWMRNEPNDWRQQNCLTFLKDQDIFGYGVHHWNDWGCDQLARYICERAPLVR